MVYTGEDSYAYWAVEGTPLAGDPSSDVHQAFNPMLSLDPPKPFYVEETQRTFDSLEPKYIYSTELTPGEKPFSGLFRDPFLLLVFFTNKTVGGSWGTGTGTITADFTSNADVDTILCQYRNADQAGTPDHIDRLLKGGLPMVYSWVFDAGKLLAEEANFRFLSFADNTQAMSLSNNFHDQAWGSGIGGWANWDTTGKRAVKDMAIKWGGTAIDGLSIKSGRMTMELGYNTDRTFDSLSHTQYWRAPREFRVDVTGLLKDSDELAEWESLYSAKTKATMQVQYDIDATYTKYVQCTNVYVENHTEPIIAPSGDATEVTITFRGGEGFALTYSGSFQDHVDPSTQITAS